jgi:hypothetical protein
MTDDLDRILASDDSIEPSSGFASGVMDAVRRQAAEPPPIPFPWARFALGLAACVALAATGAVLLVRAEPVLLAVAATFSPLTTAGPELVYAAIAVIGSLALARLPRAFSRR